MRGPHSWNQGLVRGPEDEEPGLDPLAAAADVFGVQGRPDLVLGEAGLAAARISAIAASQACERAAHGADLLRPLHARARSVKRLAVLDRKAEPGQRAEAGEHDLSTASRRLPPAWAASTSATSAAKALAATAVALAGQRVDERGA